MNELQEINATLNAYLGKEESGLSKVIPLAINLCNQKNPSQLNNVIDIASIPEEAYTTNHNGLNEVIATITDLKYEKEIAVKTI